MRIQDQVVISPINRPIKEQALASQEHYFVVNGQVSKIQVIME